MRLFGCENRKPLVKIYGTFHCIGVVFGVVAAAAAAAAPRRFDAEHAKHSSILGNPWKSRRHFLNADTLVNIRI